MRNSTWSAGLGFAAVVVMCLPMASATMVVTYVGLSGMPEWGCAEEREDCEGSWCEGMICYNDDTSYCVDYGPGPPLCPIEEDDLPGVDEDEVSCFAWWAAYVTTHPERLPDLPDSGECYYVES